MKHYYLKHLFTALLLLCATAATAHSFEVDGIYYNYVTGTNVEVTYKGSNYGYGYSGAVTIPSSVTYGKITYEVTSIRYDAFRNCPGLTSVTIPKSVTSIGNKAFCNCTGLTSITIPNSVTYLGDAFWGCTGLTSVTIPKSLTSIGPNAFRDCTGLKSITIPNSVTSIENAAFCDCTGLTSITIPNSVTSIKANAFSGCTALTSITIPNSVTSIGSCAFDNTAWYSKQSDGVVYAGKVLYKYKGTMPAWTSISVKAGTLGIAGRAFYKCTGLTSVIIPNSVTNIGDDAFYNCGFTSIVIPNSVTSIGDNAFYACKSLKSVTIPSSVTSIGRDAFYNCEGLTSIEIPGSVKSIEDWAFGYCDGLTSVTIGDGVTNIGSSAFAYCNGLKSVIIGNAVTRIGDRAFYSCDGLTSLEIPNSVTKIGSDAFCGCDGLKSITIPGSVKSIGSNAFAVCTSLTSITSYISADELFIPGNSAFYAIDKTKCTLYVPNGAKETYAATEGWNEFTNIVEMEPVGLPGDINADGEVNVGDFASLANIIFNSESIDDAIKSVSDINADGEVNVGDFAALVNLIFNSGSQASPQRAATRAAADETTFYIEPFSITAGETMVIPVLMENPGEKFSQLQFDITLPEGLEIPECFDEEQFDDVKDIKRGSRTKSVYSIQTQPVGEALRVLCITQNSKAFFTGESGDVLLITVKAADDIAVGDVEIKITNTLLSRQDGTTYKPSDCTATVSVTEGPTSGIDEMKEQRAESKDVYYDLSGRAVENPTKGINIIDGKKVLVK